MARRCRIGCLSFYVDMDGCSSEGSNHSVCKVTKMEDHEAPIDPTSSGEQSLFTNVSDREGKGT